MSQIQQLQDSNWLVEVSDQPLDINKYMTFINDPSAGALSTFSGVTRNNWQGKVVMRLEYEAYVPMALKKLKVRVGHVGLAWEFEFAHACRL